MILKISKLQILIATSAFFLMSSASQVEAQKYNYEQLIDSCKTLYPDESYIVYNSLDKYSFSQRSSNTTPMSARLESSKTLVRTRKNEPLVYYESTNSYSNIENFSAKEFLKSTGRYKKVISNSFSERYETNGIFHNDFFLNPLKIETSETGIYEMEYAKVYTDYKFLASISFSADRTPTINETIEILVPEWLEIDMIEQNFDSYNIVKTEKVEKEGIRHIYTWNGIPKFEEESYRPSTRHYLPHIILVYKSIKSSNKPRTLMADTKELYDWYSSLVREIDEDPSLIEPLVQQFKDLPKGHDQLDAVHSWIRDNIRYIAFESGIAGFKPESCQNVYTNRYGDCKGMANLCKNTLLALGFDARLAWIGTRREVPYGYEIPSLVVDNHMITAVKIDNSFIFIDPTETYGRTEEYAYRIQGRPVMIEDDENFIITNLPESKKGIDRVFRKYVVTFDDSTSTNCFSVSEVISGEPKKNILSGFNYTFAKDRDEALENYLRPYNTGSFSLNKSEGLDKANDHINFSYSFTSSEGVIDLGSEYYLDLDPSSDLEDIVVTENRIAPWFFDEKYQRETHIDFKVPDGFNVSYTPKPFIIDNEDFIMSVQVERKENSVEIIKQIVVYNGEILSKNNESWEEALSLLKEYYEDRLVISRSK